MKLRRVTPVDLAWLSRVLIHWDCSTRWALRGRTPSPRQLERLLWDQVAAQRAILKPDGEPVGLLQLTDVDFHNGVGRLAAALDPGHRAELAAPVDGFLGLCFAAFPLRKLCLNSSEDLFNAPTYFDTSLQLVGTLAQHERRSESSYADVQIYEIWRPRTETP